MSECKTEKEHFENIVAQMKSMHIYRPEFDVMVSALARSLYMQEQTVAQWKEHGFQQVEVYTNQKGAESLVKSPYFDSYLKYNEQILKYGKSLGLTPSDASKLGVALEDIGDDLGDYMM